MSKKILFLLIALIVVIIILTIFIKSPKVVTTTPSNKTKDVDTKTSVEIIFNTPISEDIKNNISITPKTEGLITFDNYSRISKKPKKVIFTPSKDLYSFTDYKIEIKEPKSWLGLKGEDFELTFDTKYILWEEMSEEQQQREIQAAEGAE